MSVLIQNEPLAYDVPIYIYRHNPYTNCSSNSLVNTLEIYFMIPNLFEVYYFNLTTLKPINYSLCNTTCITADAGTGLAGIT